MSSVKYVLDRNASSSRKQDAITKVHRELGSKVSVSGDTITVDSYDERKVADILNREGLSYSRST